MPPDREPATPALWCPRVLRGGLVVAVGLFTAQVAGFFRQVVIGYLLGTGREADALAAAMAPAEFWWSVLAVAVIFGFVPKLNPKGSRGGYAFGDVLRPVARFGAVSSLALIVFARPVVGVFAPGLEASTADLAASLLRVIATSLIAVGCGFVYDALLMSRRLFGLPSYHHAIVNVGTMAGGLALYGRLGAYAFPVGYAAGAWAQLAISHLYARPILAEQASRRHGAAKRLRMLDLLKGPAPALWHALAIEANTAASRAFASTFGSGMTAAFEYAFKLFRVPLAHLVIPISYSMLPEISAAGSSPGERAKTLKAIRLGAAATAAGALAAMVGMIGLRSWIVPILFERGRFTAASSEAVALVLLSYMPVILGRCVLETLARALLGMGKYRVPVAVTFLALAANIAVCAATPSVNPLLIGSGAIVGFSLAAAVLFFYVWRMNPDD